MTGPALVVLAAGRGSRFGGLKQFFELGPAGETMADYSLYDAWRAGFSRAVFVVREEHQASCFDRYAPRWAGRLSVEAVFQRLEDLPGGRKPPPGRSKPWGTAHALWCARERLDGPFASVNADDFYGRRAFSEMYSALGASSEGAMISYPLGETLSPTAGVARAVCRVGAGGLLEAIHELRDVRRTELGIVAGDISLEEDAPVSMNFWGFAKGCNAAFESALERLCCSSAAGLESELALPDMVAACIDEGTLRVRVLSEGRGWIGVTHRADAAAASDRLRALTDVGEYP